MKTMLFCCLSICVLVLAGNVFLSESQLQRSRAREREWKAIAEKAQATAEESQRIAAEAIAQTQVALNQVEDLKAIIIRINPLLWQNQGQKLQIIPQ